ncbi:MAG: response regulator transcription factor [Burkholderiales bacterium]|nr:response regulator transcription factor [Burkholderiales bacterium]
MTIRVLLVDDHPILRDALRLTLDREVDLEVVAEAGNGREAVALARTSRPDVVVLDIALPDVSGMEVAALMRRLDPAPRIVALSAYSDKRFVTEMLRAGAEAYVTKSSASGELVLAIRAVAAGRNYLCPEVADALVSEVRSHGGADGVPRLGRREREVLRLVAEGLRSDAIAERLSISPATVEVHRRNIMHKLGLQGAVELTRYAIREGIVVP